MTRRGDVQSDERSGVAPGDAYQVAVDGLADCDPDDAVDVSDPPPGTKSRGGRFLVELADTLRGAGLSVQEVDGWQTRARNSGGFRQEGPIAIIVHHTASGASKDGERDVNEQTFECSVKPMANLYLDRTGRWWVMAAGGTNTNGKGGPLGPIPQDSANSRVIGIEAGNNGIGEPWPDVMQDSYVAGVAALADQYGIPTAHVFAHHEWAPSRKIDPAGPSRFGSINRHQCWNMDEFRAAVAGRRGGAALSSRPAFAVTPAAPTAGTYVVQPGDSWWSIARATTGDPATQWPLVAAANGGAERVLRPGEVLTIPGAPEGSEPERAGIPPFPGVAQEGDSGPVVLTWQQALIAAGVINDDAANRDAFYGSGLRKALLELQMSWGWTDADGKAGEHTWSELHGRLLSREASPIQRNPVVPTSAPAGSGSSVVEVDRRSSGVCISSASNDERIAVAVADALARDGWAPFQVRRSPSNPDWRTVLTDFVAEADSCVVLIGDRPGSEDRAVWRVVLESKWSNPAKVVVVVMLGNAPIPPAFAECRVVRMPSQPKSAGEQDELFSHVMVDLMEALTLPVEFDPARNREFEETFRERLDRIGELSRRLQLELDV